MSMWFSVMSISIQGWYSFEDSIYNLFLFRVSKMVLD